MKCTIKDLEEGKEYVFLRCMIKQKEDIPIYHGTLKELFKGEVIMATFEIHEFNTDVYFYKPVKNRYTGDMSNEILDEPQLLDSDFPGELKIIIRTPGIGFMISDTEENAVIEYEEFLKRSLEKYKEKVNQSDEYDRLSFQADWENKQLIYKQQVNWLRKKYIEGD